MFDDIMGWISIGLILCCLVGGWFRFLDFLRDVYEAIFDRSAH